MPQLFRIALLLMLLTSSEVVNAQLQPAQPAPRFSLQNLQGVPIAINNLQGKQLLILYFFDMDSRPSLEGLNALNQLYRQYRDEISVFGISSSRNDKIVQYVRKNGITFPVLHDTGQVSTLYHARKILPVGCIIGSGFKVLEYFQGGGNWAESAMLKTVKSELKGRRLPAQSAGSVIHSNRPTTRQPAASTVTEPSVKGSRDLPSKTEDNGTHGNVGRIISEKEW